MRNFFFLLLVLVYTPIWAEGNLAPSFDMAGPVPLPLSSHALPAMEKQAQFCFENPCHTRCSQIVTCKNYNPEQDKCTKPKDILVDWKCNQPCSCASDGTVVCDVSYRCVNMTEEMNDLAKFKKPITIEMEIPFSNYKDSQTPIDDKLTDEAKTNDE